jgi:ornithine cyclodeaminase
MRRPALQAIEDRIRYLSDSDVADACAGIDALSCITDALLEHAAGTAKVGAEGFIYWTPASGQSARTLNMPGLLENNQIVGTKIINANTGNPDRALPRADGLTLLFDPRSARPKAILAGARISALRTAAVSTVAAQRLHKSTPGTLAVIGAGKIGESHVRLMAKHLKVNTVLISDQVPERARILVNELRDQGDLSPDISVAEVEHSIRRADIIVTATTVTGPYIHDDWISPGALVANVSLDDIEESTYMRSDLLYVDDWQLITADTRRLLGRLARAGRVSGPGEPAPAGGRGVTGTLGQLLANTCPSRLDDTQTVIVNPFGMAIEDLAIAQRVYEVAVARDLGILLRR